MSLVLTIFVANKALFVVAIEIRSVKAKQTN